MNLSPEEKLTADGWAYDARRGMWSDPDDRDDHKPPYGYHALDDALRIQADRDEAVRRLEAFVKK